MAGAARRTQQAAQFNYDATVATYRETALDAFQQVEDNLAALRVLEKETASQRAAVAAAEKSLGTVDESLYGRAGHLSGGSDGTEYGVGQ
ncbi:MAG: hypothetical protein WDO73_08025 [Ignavibacteriota bacterium]